MTTGTVALTLALTLAAPFRPAQTSAPAAARDNTPDKPDFSGTWSIDRSLSADLSKIDFTGRGAANGGPRGRQGGFGRRGGGFGGRQRPADRNIPGALTDLEKSRLQALTDEIRTSFDRLVISHHDPMFVVNDAHDRTQFFQTTGANDDNHLGDVTVSSTTHWEGPRLVTTYTLSSRMKLVATYTILPRTNQMVLRFVLEDSDLRGAADDVKLAYTRG